MKSSLCGLRPDHSGTLSRIETYNNGTQERETIAPIVTLVNNQWSRGDQHGPSGKGACFFLQPNSQFSK